MWTKFTSYLLRDEIVIYSIFSTFVGQVICQCVFFFHRLDSSNIICYKINAHRVYYKTYIYPLFTYIHFDLKWDRYYFPQWSFWWVHHPLLYGIPLLKEGFIRLPKEYWKILSLRYLFARIGYFYFHLLYDTCVRFVHNMYTYCVLTWRVHI